MSEEVKEMKTASFVASGEWATLIGEKHTYRIPLMKTIHGISLFHKYIRIFGADTDAIMKKFREAAASYGVVGELDAIALFKWLVTGDDSVAKIRHIIAEAFTLDVMIELSTMMLAGAEIDDETCDELGMCDLFGREPDEFYTALILAIAANYPGHFPFVLDRLDTEVSPSHE